MSYDKEDTGNVDNDMVEESYVRKIKKDAYFVMPTLWHLLMLLLSGRIPRVVAQIGSSWTNWRRCNRCNLPRRTKKRNNRQQSNTRQGECESRKMSLYRTVASSNRSVVNEGTEEEWVAAANGFHGSGSNFSSINGGGGSSINCSSKFGSFPNLDSEQWSKLLTLLNNPNSAQTNTLSGMKNL
ncbi:hypothetical protein M9H77_08307 [Catharanthus roseus]|uniref:Uncharacterized protein n=1 Tax=Catharanthus roseus TaxID=4058 RepID=A0ACC0BXL6_CATRO|nr:hypothetical protein M9H77_08307 [Catharanthus roseus]